MRINHNIPALRTLHQMSSTNSKIDKTMQKLSSGLRINSASDDAAGLAIAQKMDTQVRGLKQANRNSMDGISLIQTAEGALNEVHSMLQRTRELSIQASNGTLTAADRKAITDEVGQLKAEIDRISEHIEYNEKKLLNGEIDRRSFSNLGTAGKVISMSDGVGAQDYKFKVAQAASQTCVVGDGTAIAANTIFDSSTPPKVKDGVSGSININGEQVKIEAGDSEQIVFAKVRDLCDTMGIDVAVKDGGTYEKDKTLVMVYREYGPKDIKILGEESILKGLGLYGLGTVAADPGLAATAATAVADAATAAAVADVSTLVADAATKVATAADAKVAAATKAATAATKAAAIAAADASVDAATKAATAAAAVAADTAAAAAVADAAIAAADAATAVADAATDEAAAAAADAAATAATTAVNLEMAGKAGINQGGDLKLAEIPFTTGSQSGEFPPGTTFKVVGNIITFEANNGFKLVVEGGKAVRNLENGKWKDTTLGTSTEPTSGLLRGEVALSLLETGPLDLQIGANEGQMMQLRIQNMSTTALGLDDMNLNTADKSQEAITLVDAAIAQVSSARSKLGAYQNRLEHTVANLDVAAENMTASMSRIQDADMALEMATYTKDNILAQAGNAMLAQANQRPQQILQLLQ